MIARSVIVVTKERFWSTIAERCPTTEDWEEINRAFRENDTLLFGIKPQEEAERLSQNILSLAPAPIGYGG